jgi:hypothetical protein
MEIMKKTLIFLFLTAYLLGGCGKEEDFSSTVIVSKDRNIQVPLQLAQEEFERLFSHLEALQIVGANAADRTDDNSIVVVEIAYTSKTENDTYGFLCDTDENGNTFIVRHGRDVTVELLTK